MNGCPSVGYYIDELAPKEYGENSSDEAWDGEETEEAKIKIVRRLSECSVGGESEYRIPKFDINTGYLIYMA